MRFFKTFYGTTFKDNKNFEKIVITGYQEYQKKAYLVGANNFEVYTVLNNKFEKDFGITSKEMEEIIKEYEIKFQELVESMFSYMDVGVNTAENFYHAFVLGMLVGLKDTYYIKSNRESGRGRYHVMLEPKDKKGNSFIMEFKVYKKQEEKDLKKQ